MLTLMTVLLVAVVGIRRRRRTTAGKPRLRARTRSVILVSAILAFNMTPGTSAEAKSRHSIPDIPNPCTDILGKIPSMPYLPEACDKVFDAVDRAVRNACTDAPDIQRPGAGLVGAVDPSRGHGSEGSVYRDYGYAGMVWQVYDDNCVLPKPVTDPMTTIDTWTGNQLFNLGKFVVGVTNSLHYALYDGRILERLNNKVKDLAQQVFDNIYLKLAGLFLLVLAVLMFRHIWRGDLASVSKRALFALCGMWFASSTVVMVGNYGRIDDTIVGVTTGIQNGFVEPEKKGDARDTLPTELHTKVVYDNWLRGEFGSPDTEQARKLGRTLLDAQAWTWEQEAQSTNEKSRNQTENGKKSRYKQFVYQLGPTAGTFTGTDGSRMGAGFLSFLQALVYSLFQLFAKFAVLLAQLLLRILTLTAPIIGLVAVVHHEILRRVGKAAAAVVLNVLVLAILAGVHSKFLQLIFGPGMNLSLTVQMLLGAIVTLVFIRAGRPLQRIWQMVDLSMGAVGISNPTAERTRRTRPNRPSHNSASAQGGFWSGVRERANGKEKTRTVTAGRPEARPPVPAVAQPRHTGNSPAGATRSSTSNARRRRTVILEGNDKAANRRNVHDDVHATPKRAMMTPNTAPAGDRDYGRPKNLDYKGPRTQLVYRPSTGRVEPAPSQQPRSTLSDSEAPQTR
ncbi:magnesium transporter [Actinophytocola sp.]|uniref:magnesium transporter n=1 Tax=Actinophytocola sp. TaxID=1872138 RepID=UPI003899FAFF